MSISCSALGGAGGYYTCGNVGKQRWVVKSLVHFYAEGCPASSSWAILISMPWFIVLGSGKGFACFYHIVVSYIRACFVWSTIAYFIVVYRSSFWPYLFKILPNSLMFRLVGEVFRILREYFTV